MAMRFCATVTIVQYAGVADFCLAEFLRRRGRQENDLGPTRKGGAAGDHVSREASSKWNYEQVEGHGVARQLSRIDREAK